MSKEVVRYQDNYSCHRKGHLHSPHLYRRPRSGPIFSPLSSTFTIQCRKKDPHHFGEDRMRIFQFVNQLNLLALADCLLIFLLQQELIKCEGCVDAQQQDTLLSVELSCFKSRHTEDRHDSQHDRDIDKQR